METGLQRRPANRRPYHSRQRQAQNCSRRNATELSFSRVNGNGHWLPIQPTTEMQKDRGSHFFYILASLKPDVTLPQAQAELDAITKRIREEDPIKNRDVTFQA